MIYHIVCLAGSNDNYLPVVEGNEQIIIVPFNISGHADSFQTNIYDIFAQYNLTPSLIANDLLNVAIAAYTADVRVARENTFDGWTREINLHLAVSDTILWAEGIDFLQQALSFLTGDYWRAFIRQLPKSYEAPEGKKPKKSKFLKSKTVCLFSGGLDSFIGAIDQIEKNGKVVLVGHHSAGGGATSKSQNDSIRAIHQSYSEDSATFAQIWLTPPKGESRASEISTRGRSMLFICLGVVIANGMGANSLIIPENGLISLNIPLTNSRLGSFSTRTTHPYFIYLMRKLLLTLKISVNIELPYRFNTKGEMIVNSSNYEFIRQNLDATISCSHPGASRFSKKSPNLHCGYCYPCLIRRAATYSTGNPDRTEYVYADLSQPLTKIRRSDLRTLKIALDKYQQRVPQIKDVLISGPLPVTDLELQKYHQVFLRGLEEVSNFLQKYK